MKIKNNNKNRIKKLASKAFKKTAIAYAEKNREVIEEKRYWSGFEGSVTRRQNGTVVTGANRSIDDLGNLKNSQKLVLPMPGVAQLSWDGNGKTPVQNVYFGYRTENTFVPGRMWDKQALSEINLSKTFVKYFN